MLVLARKLSEGITIGLPGREIHVMVIAIQGDRVKLGIEAPRDVPVNRDEILLQIRQGIREGEPLSKLEAAMEAADHEQG